jgi:hypothetical protein
VAFFEVIGLIEDVAAIASGRGVRRASFLRKRFGGGRWRKMKGLATIRDEFGQIRRAELHWYEANGVGRRGTKIKRFLD